MRIILPVAALGLAAWLCLTPTASWAQETYVPAIGEEAVIYTHRFKPEEFEKGLKIVQEGFTAAQAALGQKRHNTFLVDPAGSEVVVVSFFAKGESVDEWHEFMGRLDVLDRLAPLRREPLSLKRFEVRAITTTP